jgi:hypothetical protein
MRVADVDRPGEIGEQQPHDAVDQVVDVAHRPGLTAVSLDGERLARESLGDEVRDSAAVVRTHPRPVGVEDAQDCGVDAVLGAVGGGERLGEPLGLVVAAARADRVDVAPVTFRLGVDQRVAV